MLPCPNIIRGSVIAHANALVLKVFQCEQHAISSLYLNHEPSGAA